MNKKLAMALMATSLAASADNSHLYIDPNDILTMQPTVKTWTLHGTLAMASIKYDSDYSSTTIIPGYQSFKECMKAGSRLVATLNESVATIEADQEEHLPAKWTCSKGFSGLRGKTIGGEHHQQSVDKVSKTKTQTGP
ncbi:hypothetical protein [Stutzerimonas nitrititolerans]|uniref:hypothetical protein n=1 Tax=Stutzerimonas nitrititolerans TaxID=2482751 RepID=UPI0028A21707|nr:hypothetical protein [Stutzerimonas nitrititolerans]